MAQTQHNAPHVVSDSGNGALFTETEWHAAAESRKYKVDDGQVWLHSDGRLFPMPLPNFANPAVKALVFQALAQFVGTRIGQTAEGDVAKAVRAALIDGEIPRANSNDAYEAIYLAEIAARMEKRGVAPPDKNATAAEKADYAGSLKLTADAARGALFLNTIEAAKANVVRAPTDKKRRTSTAPKGTVVSVLD